MAVQAGSEKTLLVQVHNKESKTTQKGFIFIYSDEYLSKLLGVCCVEVRAVTQLSFKVREGEEYEYLVNICNTPFEDGQMQNRTIEFVSSNQEVIYPPFGKQRNVQILKDFRNMP